MKEAAESSSKEKIEEGGPSIEQRFILVGKLCRKQQDQDDGCALPRNIGQKSTLWHSVCPSVLQISYKNAHGATCLLMLSFDLGEARCGFRIYDHGRTSWSGWHGSWNYLGKHRIATAFHFKGDEAKLVIMTWEFMGKWRNKALGHRRYCEDVPASAWMVTKLPSKRLWSIADVETVVDDSDDDDDYDNVWNLL